MPELELFVSTEQGLTPLSDEELMAQGGTALPDKEVASVLDLNADSHAAVQAMGQDEADTLAVVPRPPGYVGPAVLPGAPVAGGAAPENAQRASVPKTAFDRTHLGSKGAAYFARMVERELLNVLPDLRGEFSGSDQ